MARMAAVSAGLEVLKKQVCVLNGEISTHETRIDKQILVLEQAKAPGGRLHLVEFQEKFIAGLMECQKLLEVQRDWLQGGLKSMNEASAVYQQEQKVKRLLLERSQSEHIIDNPTSFEGSPSVCHDDITLTTPLLPSSNVM
mmetsp:Transcript_19474/g.33664  ORF Transcript_19474/g.33664 Transcript_19474/m.33664 type:complete len:141 (+) Transcript_19474:31-453(+)